MKKTFVLFSLCALAVGCSSYYPPRTSMYSNYGFSYDYSESPVPAAGEVPAITTGSTQAPTFLVQVPPPTVIYQTTQAPVVQSSVATNTTAQANPYQGSYLIPPKVVVVPQQTIIREGAGAAPAQATVTSTPAAPQQPQFYPGTSYVFPGTVAVPTVDTNAPGTNTNTNVVVTNTFNQTNITSRTNATSVTNTAAPFTPVPGPTNVATPPAGTAPTSTLQRPRTQSTTGSGTGQPAQSTSGGAFAPPPPGTSPLPGTQPK